MIISKNLCLISYINSHRRVVTNNSVGAFLADPLERQKPPAPPPRTETPTPHEKFIRDEEGIIIRQANGGCCAVPIECVRDEDSNHLDPEYKNDTEHQLQETTKKIAPQAAVPIVPATAITSGKEDSNSGGDNFADEILKLKYSLDHRSYRRQSSKRPRSKHWRNSLPWKVFITQTLTEYPPKGEHSPQP